MTWCDAVQATRQPVGEAAIVRGGMMMLRGMSLAVGRVQAAAVAAAAVIVAAVPAMRGGAVMTGMAAVVCIDVMIVTADGAMMTAVARGPRVGH